MAGKKHVKLNTIFDCSSFLGAVINKLYRGEISASTAGRLGYLINILIGSLKDSELESRILELEKKIDNSN